MMGWRDERIASLSASAVCSARWSVLASIRPAWLTERRIETGSPYWRWHLLFERDKPNTTLQSHTIRFPGIGLYLSSGMSWGYYGDMMWRYWEESFLLLWFFIIKNWQEATELMLIFFLFYFILNLLFQNFFLQTLNDVFIFLFIYFFTAQKYCSASKLFRHPKYMIWYFGHIADP